MLEFTWYGFKFSFGNFCWYFLGRHCHLKTNCASSQFPLDNHNTVEFCYFKCNLLILMTDNNTNSNTFKFIEIWWHLGGSKNVGPMSSPFRQTKWGKLRAFFSEKQIHLLVSRTAFFQQLTFHQNWPWLQEKPNEDRFSIGTCSAFATKILSKRILIARTLTAETLKVLSHTNDCFHFSLSSLSHFQIITFQIVYLLLIVDCYHYFLHTHIIFHWCT